MSIRFLLTRRDALRLGLTPVGLSLGASGKWEMRLSTSTVHYPTLGVRAACERIAAAGYKSVDIWGEFRGCRHLEEAADKLGADGVKELLDELDLDLAAFSVYRPGYERFAEMLGALGGGIAVRGSAPDSEGSLTAKMREFQESVKPLLEIAEAQDSNLAIENHSGKPLLNHLDSLKAFVDLNRNPRLGIALAPYHVQKNGESVEEAIAICGEQLMFFYAWQWGDGLDQLPGHGPTDFAPWLEGLARIRYRGPVNAFMHGEIDPDVMSEALRKAKRYLEERYLQISKAG